MQQPLITPPGPGGAPPPAGPAGPAAMPAPGAAGPAPGAPGAPGAGGVDPQRQQQYDLLVTNALEFIHGPQLEQVLARLRAGEPAEAAGAIAGEIMAGQLMSAAAAGVQIDRGALLHGTNEVVGAVLEVAAAAQIIPEPVEATAVNLAFVAALDKVIAAAQQAGIVTEHEIAQARQMSEQLRNTPQGREAFAKAGPEPGAMPGGAPAPMAAPGPGAGAPAAGPAGAMPGKPLIGGPMR